MMAAVMFVLIYHNKFESIGSNLSLHLEYAGLRLNIKSNFSICFSTSFSR